MIWNFYWFLKIYIKYFSNYLGIFEFHPSIEKYILVMRLHLRVSLFWETVNDVTLSILVSTRPFLVHRNTTDFWVTLLCFTNISKAEWLWRKGVNQLTALGAKRPVLGSSLPLLSLARTPLDVKQSSGGKGRDLGSE